MKKGEMPGKKDWKGLYYGKNVHIMNMRDKHIRWINKNIRCI